MLATARHLTEPTEGYWRPDHPVQQRIRRALEDMTGCALGADASASTAARCPTGRSRWWALPAPSPGSRPARAWRQNAPTPVGASAEACWAHPELVAGQGQLVTEILQRLGGRVLVKSGAEGVYCGAFAERGLGFALKIDDGAKRAAEAAVVQVIASSIPRRGNWAPIRASPIGAACGWARCAPADALDACCSACA